MALLLLLGSAHDLWRARPGREAARFEARPPVPADSAAATQGAPRSPAVPPRAASAATEAIDLNRAGVAELDRLPGVGPVLAGRIVEHRNRHGPFVRLEDLLAVRGIGPRLVERLRGHVTVGASARSSPRR